MIDAEALLERFRGQPGQPQPGAPPAAGHQGGMPLDLGAAGAGRLGGPGGAGGQGGSAGGAGGYAGDAGAAAAGGLLAQEPGKKGRRNDGVPSHRGAALRGVLAHRLALPAELVAPLDRQAEAALRGEAG